MSYQADRDRCIATASARGISFDTIRALLRCATTIERLNVAQCNGNWPADNGERRTDPCPDCGIGWAPSSFRRGKCPDCRTPELVDQTLTGSGWFAYIQGDPRGPGLTIYPFNTPREDIQNGRARSTGIYVPGRVR